MLRPPGIVVGVWRILDMVARDDTLEVYSAIHISLPLPAIVKILVGGGEPRRKRFENEEKFLRESGSGAFPRLMGSGDFDGYPYIVTEFLKPMELPRSDKEVEKFIIAVALGLREMHMKGYAHGSLTPQIIMRRPCGDPVIMELGKLDASPSDDISSIGELVRVCFFGYPPFCWRGVVERAISPRSKVRYSSIGDFIYGVHTRTYAMRMVLSIVFFSLLGIAAAISVFWVLRR